MWVVYIEFYYAKHIQLIYETRSYNPQTINYNQFSLKYYQIKNIPNCLIRNLLRYQSLFFINYLSFQKNIFHKVLWSPMAYKNFFKNRILLDIIEVTGLRS